MWICCLNAIPVPGMRAVTAGPWGPTVKRRGPAPTEVLIPRGENVKRTPGIGLKLFLKRHPMLTPPVVCEDRRLTPRLSRGARTRPSTDHQPAARRQLKSVIRRLPREWRVMSRSVLTNELFQQLVDDDVPFITVLHDAPKVGSGARRDAHCAHRTVPTLVPSFARRGEPTPMEGRDVPGHVTGGNDVVLERRVGPRQRDSGQNPEESRAVRS